MCAVKRIQLSRPTRTVSCMVPTGTMHAQTASSAEGVSPCINWMLSRMEVEVNPEGGRLTEISSRTRGRVSFAGVRSSVAVLYGGTRATIEVHHVFF